MAYQQRRQRLQRKLKRLRLDIFFITNPNDLRWLCGFNGTTGLLAVGQQQAFLYLDGRYLKKGQDEARGVTVRPPVVSSNDLQRLADQKKSPLRVGFDGDRVSAAQAQRWARRFPDCHFRQTTNVLFQLRQRKDSGELDLLRQAGNRLALIWDDCRAQIRPGLRESEIAALFGSATFQHTGAAPTFPTIVAAGANAARPHHTASAHRLGTNDLLLIDIGISWQGYCVDMTRMLSFGKRTRREQATGQLVKQAKQAAQRACAAGAPAITVAEAARRVFRHSNVERYFIHSLGHGVGLDIHEFPRLSRESEQVLRQGMVFTVEPGLYYPGRFGIRLEDTFILRRSRLECLTPVPVEWPA